MEATYRPGRGVFAWLAAIAIGLPLGLMLLLGATGEVPVPASALAIGVAVPLALAAVIAVAIRRNAIALAPTAVVVRSSFYRFSVPPSRIDPESIRRVDVLVDRDWRPRWRTNGIGLPGYQSGWFRMADRRRGFLALAGRAGLGFRTRDGVSVLVSPVEIDAVEAKLRELAASPGA